MSSRLGWIASLLAMAACAQRTPEDTTAASSPSALQSTALVATDGTDARPTVDAEYAIVQLKGDPLSTYVKTKPPQGKKIDFNSNTVKSYRAQLSALRNDFKAWLRANAPAAKVTGEFDLSLNAVALKLNGESLGKIATAPQVNRAEYQGLYYPNTDPPSYPADPDLALISAFGAWGPLPGGPVGAGAGVKVAIIDTGIDITHPCFSGTDYPKPDQVFGDRTLTNNKVIAAKVFNNKTPSRGYTAYAQQEHGTHVAGTVACNYGTPATVDGVAISHPISGVAPAALLGNYNIFPGDVTNARSEDIMNALEAAYTDGFDVANMSLGGGAHGIQDLLTVVVDDLDQAGMVVAVAAGNSGPGHYTVESPGSAARALTAGAASVGHFIAAPITANGTPYPGVAGDFATVSSDLTAVLAAVPGSTKNANALDTACSPLAADVSGKIAMVSRGSCGFSVKIRYAQAAGAIAVIVSNNADGDAIAMGQDGTPNQPTIPAYMVSLSDGALVKAADGKSVTIGVQQKYFISGNDDFMAGFSSQGPTDVDFRVKPDVVAPGVNVLSSIPTHFCGGAPCFAFFQGTSMATPHLAGTAAFLHGAHPAWSAAQIRSAIVNTAAQGILKKSSGTGKEPDVNIIGAGREDVLAASGAKVALEPVSVSFGAVPSGSGQTRRFDVTLTNLSGANATYTLNVNDLRATGVTFSVSPATLAVAAGNSGTITVIMSADKGAALGNNQAILSVSSGGTEVAHAAVYTFVK